MMEQDFVKVFAEIYSIFCARRRKKAKTRQG